MTYEERVVRRSDETVDPVVTTGGVRSDVVDRSVVVSPSGGEVFRRLIVLIFGVIQIVIALRIVLLLLDAREANSIVAFILDISQLFVAPFEGIFRTNALSTGGSVLDVAAVVALVGWTVLEVILLWIASVARREA
jgi:hypothetical protein